MAGVAAAGFSGLSGATQLGLKLSVDLGVRAHLACRLRSKEGAALLAVILLPMSPAVFWRLSELISGFLVNPILGTVGVALLSLALWRVRHRV